MSQGPFYRCFLFTGESFLGILETYCRLEMQLLKGLKRWNLAPDPAPPRLRPFLVSWGWPTSRVLTSPVTSPADFVQQPYSDTSCPDLPGRREEAALAQQEEEKIEQRKRARAEKKALKKKKKDQRADKLGPMRMMRWGDDEEGKAWQDFHTWDILDLRQGAEQHRELHSGTV